MKHKTNKASGNKSASDSAPAYRGSLGYLAIGGAIGATLALLFAPKPGRQLRGDIADVSRKGLDSAKEAARGIQEKTGDIASSVKEKADAVYGYASRKGAAGSDTIYDAAASAADSWADKQDSKLSETKEGFRPPNNIG